MILLYLGYISITLGIERIINVRVRLLTFPYCHDLSSWNCVSCARRTPKYIVLLPKAISYVINCKRESFTTMHSACNNQQCQREFQRTIISLSAIPGNYLQRYYTVMLHLNYSNSYCESVKSVFLIHGSLKVALHMQS